VVEAACPAYSLTENDYHVARPQSAPSAIGARFARSGRTLNQRSEHAPNPGEDEILQLTRNIACHLLHVSVIQHGSMHSSRSIGNAAQSHHASPLLTQGNCFENRTHANSIGPNPFEVVDFGLGLVGWTDKPSVDALM
jgi:hypothetical protein